MASKASILFILLISISYVSATPKCYGLSLEGGGSHGAYEAGIVQALVQHLPANQVMWNIITGISTGSLNTCQASFFAYGNETAMANYMVESWQQIKNNSMICPIWPEGEFYSLFFKSSVTNPAPLKEFVRSRTGTKVLRNVTIGTTNIDTGLFGQFSEELGAETLIQATLCSAAAPLAFPPEPLDNSWWVDGGITLNINGFNAINRCRAQGYADKNIVIDLLYDNNQKALPLFTMNTTKEVLSRIHRIQNHYNRYWFETNLEKNFPNVDFRYIIYPSEQLPPYDMKIPIPLDFNPEDIQTEINIGFKDGTNAVLLGKTGLQHLKLERMESQIHYF
jgi:predicted acylesterase/phospholipase RssA